MLLTELNFKCSSTFLYLSLDHKSPVHAHIINNSEDVHHAFSFNLENQLVNGNEGPCSSHTSTEKFTRSYNEMKV